ncbi:MAG: tyrosine-type recombinase/integrase [Ferruginibacter sp.]
MVKITLKPLQHRNQECIGIYAEARVSVNNAVHKKAGAKWSQTNRCWYIPLSKEHYDQLRLALTGIAEIDNAALHQYLTDKKSAAGKSPVPLLKQDGPVRQDKKANYPSKPAVGTVQRLRVIEKKKPVEKIHAVNAHIIPAMEQRLRLKSYSPSTRKTYLNEVSAFLRMIQQHPADDFTTQRIKDYLEYCSVKLQLTENTLHSRINALKFYYEQVLKREKFFWDIPRPKKPSLLPKVLSKEEIIRLLKAIDNVKHKTMLMLGYACGLRVSEITAVELKDVDEDRRLLFIRRAKGKKDRMVSLSPVMLVMLRAYITKYKPLKYLFEGQVTGGTYSTRSLELIIKAAKQKAGINKTGSMHMLRHSFATHLIDKGTDVVFIQKLLGHNDLKTTLRYLHVTNKDMLNILSPIEDIKDFL